MRRTRRGTRHYGRLACAAKVVQRASPLDMMFGGSARPVVRSQSAEAEDLPTNGGASVVPVGDRWRLDETYVKVKGQHRYLYRAVDKGGSTIDFLLTARRDRAAALRFLEKATGKNGLPELINIDKSGANTAGIEDYNDAHEGAEIETRQCKYLNNIVEQDHRNIKRRTRPMLGFKSFRAARIVLGGIELVHMLRKGQLSSAAGDAQMTAAEAFYQLAA